MCFRSKACACIWFNTRHASTRPNAQLLLADELPLLCACAVRPLTEIYDCSIGPRIAVNWIAVSFELRHYERGIFFSFFFYISSLVCWPFSRSRFNGFRLRFHKRPTYTLLHAYIYLFRVLRGNSELTLSCLRLCRNSNVCIRPELEVERFDALNTFDVNLISGPLTERTNFGQKRKQ